MTENDNFERLAWSLSLDERQNLLERMKGQSSISSDPLYIEEPAEKYFSGIEERYAALPWYYRLMFFILGLIKGKPAAALYADNSFSELGREIASLSPGYFDYQKGKLLPAFYSSLDQLKEAARFFYSALDAGFNREKGAFYAFLGSLEMEAVHRKLQEGTDITLIAEQRPKATEGELRKVAAAKMEDALSMVTDEYKSVMYFDARSLYCLKELSSFLFDRVMMTFAHDSSYGGHACSVNIVRQPLFALNDILFSLKAVPPMPLLESLFVFLLRDKSDERGFDIGKEIRSLLMKAEDALAVIREFNKRTPLTKILRCGTRDFSVSPKEISGGEDWFAVYREYWRQRIEKLISSYMKGKRQSELLDSFKMFFSGTNLKLISNTASESNPDGLPVKGSLALSFLLTFYPVVFVSELNSVLKPILIDGEFYRKENRLEFTESYNELLKLEDDIRHFEADISPGGDYGKRYSQSRQEITSLPVKRRKVQIVIEEASSQAVGIIESARRASRSMINILSGISSENGTGGRFETLSNLEKLSGKGTEFVDSIKSAIKRFQAVIGILDDIDAIEMGR